MSKESRATTRVAVLAGGNSSEREISLCSGANAAKALRDAGYGTVEHLDPAAPDFLARLTSGSYDVAFLAMHGTGGEDGTLQHVLEFVGMPYTGSDGASSCFAADKEISKLIYVQAGIPVARGVALTRGEEYDPARIADAVGSQLFVKPAINGSSYGVSLVTDVEELPAAVDRAFEYGEKVLVEERLLGTEITVGVFGDEELTALPIVEICVPEQVEFYDLDVKYVVSDDIHRIPARLSPDDYARAQELACAAHRALGCLGFSRTDFIVGERGPVALETNTIPGMTDTSLYPDELRHAGMEFSEVCAALVDMALARAKRQ